MEEIMRATFLGTLVILFISVNALFLVWLERKVSARIQLRRGPLHVGPEGMFQTIADAIKLISKELTTPQHSNRFLYIIAPMLVFCPIIASFIVIPLSPTMIIQDLNIGFLLIFAMSSLGFIGIFIGGWASNSKYAAMGAIRSIAQNVAYEIPLLLSVMGVVLLASSLQMGTIVKAQSSVWYIFLQPVAALVFLCSVLGETNRAPFDIPEAESELVAGFHTEYSGMRFALFFLGEYTHVFLGAALMTTLFLGGWYLGPLSGATAFLVKTYLIVFVIMWIRWTFPRLRSDQLIHFAWKVLIPISIVNLLITAFIVAL